MGGLNFLNPTNKMKIDQDLRVAIRAAANNQPRRDYSKERDFEKAEILRVVTSIPEWARAHKKHQARLKRAQKECAEAEKFYAHLGVVASLTGIRDYQKFKLAGGKVPPEHSTWKAEVVIAELTAATPKRGKELLKKYGINWESA